LRPLYIYIKKMFMRLRKNERMCKMMMLRKATELALIIAVTCMMTLSSLTDASGALDDTLDIRPGQFTNNQTAGDFSIDLEAIEEDNGRGSVTLIIRVKDGPNLFCSAHGPRPMINFGTGGGNQPLTGIQCGTAFGMPVSFDGCSASMEIHGYGHFHHPMVTYMGMVTAELTFHKRQGEGEGTVKIEVHTPKNTIILNGKINDMDGVSNIDMLSCP